MQSWIITRKATGEVIGEFYDRKMVARFNPATCRIETALEYLGRFNAEIAASDGRCQRHGKPIDPQANQRGHVHGAGYCSQCQPSHA